MTVDEISEIIESMASPAKRRVVNSDRCQPTRNEINLYRKQLLDFLQEIDGAMTVEELREAIDEGR